MKLRYLLPALAVLAASCSFASEPVALRVVLYPIVPDARDVFFRLESEFERANSGVDLQLVETYVASDGKTKLIADDYYREGLVRAEADVYEIDTVLLGDMIATDKLQPVDLPSEEFVSNALAAVNVNGTNWGVPHWICGNYLFYDKQDEAIAKAQTFSDLAATLKAGELAVDLKGTSTLGEWYVTQIAGTNGERHQVLQSVADPHLADEVVAGLRTLLNACPVAFCRSEDFHNRPGFYARAFARGELRAYIGYSESLFYALQELASDCTATSRCRSEAAIAVKPLPLHTAQGRHVGWSDAFGLRAGLNGLKKAVALKFIKFAVAPNTFKMVLAPKWPDPPSYLIPAIKVPELSDIGSLYPTFLAGFDQRLVLSGPGLNSALRTHGKQLNCALPPDRTDDDWFDECESIERGK